MGDTVILTTEELFQPQPTIATTEELFGAPSAVVKSGKEELRAAHPSRYEKWIRPVLQKIGFVETPEEKIGRAQAVYGEAKELAKEKGIGLKEAMSYLDRNWDDYIWKRYGLTTPRKANERMANLMLSGWVGGGLATTPLLTLKGIATFLGAKTIAGLTAYPLVKAIEDRLKNRPAKYKFIWDVKELLPEEATAEAEALTDVIELIGLAAITGGVMRRAPHLAERLTKKVVTEYKLPQKMYFSPKELRGMSEAEVKNLLVRDLGLKGDEVRMAMKSGVEVGMPAEKVVRVVDRPYWRRLKRVLRVKPFEKVKVMRVEPTGEIKPLSLPPPIGVTPEAEIIPTPSKITSELPLSTLKTELLDRGFSEEQLANATPETIRMLVEEEFGPEDVSILPSGEVKFKPEEHQLYTEVGSEVTGKGEVVSSEEIDALPQTKEGVKKVIRKLVSRYPEKIKTQEDLQRVGEKMAKDLGIKRKIKWVLVRTKTSGITGLANRSKGEIRIRVGYSETPAELRRRIGEKRYKERLVKAERYRMKHRESPFPVVSQGRIKKAMLHELIHYLPEVQAKRVRGVAHPPIFWEKLYKKQKELLYEWREVEVVEPIEPPPPPPPISTPPAVPDSPNYEPQPPSPEERMDDLHSLSKWKEFASKVIGVIDVETPFRMIGAPETGFHIKNIFSYIGAIQERGLVAIRRLNRIMKEKVGEVGMRRLTAKDWANVTYYASQPSKMEKVGKEEYGVYSELVYEVNRLFERFAEIGKKEGVIVEEWPQSLIERLKDEMAEAKSVEEAEELEDTIEFLKSEVKYVHIPLRVWLEKSFDRNPTATTRILSTTFRERKTIDIEELAERLRRGGLIDYEDIDVRTVIGAYAHKFGHLAAMSRIVNAAVKEKLIVDRKLHPEWPRWNKRWGVRLKGKVVHPFLYNSLDNFSKVANERPLRRLFAYTKMLSFINPFFLGYIDLHQGFWLGALRSVKTPVYVVRAIRSLMEKDELFLNLLEEGIAGKPFVVPFKDYMKEVELARASDSFLNSALTYLEQTFKRSGWVKGVGALPISVIDMVMRPIWYTSWEGDLFIRLISAHYLLDLGFDVRSAAQLTSFFHADYPSVPTQTRRKLNMLIFTPIYAINMMKLEGTMLGESGKVLANALRKKKSSERSLMLVHGLMGLVALVMLKHLWMRMHGYKADMFGYRYTKRVMTDKGEKELVVVWPAPENVILRYYYKFRGWPVSPSDFMSKLNRAAFAFQPLLRVGIRVATNRRDDGVTPIANWLDPPALVAKDYITFVVGSVVRISKDIFPDEEELKNREAVRKFEEDVGKLWSWFVKPAVYVYLREMKDVRLKKRMFRLMEEFRGMTKKKPPRDWLKAREKLEEIVRSLK